MRCDVNISVRPRGTEKFGVKTEIKNLNSFRFVEKAIEFEVGRQIEVLEAGGKIQQETHLWDPVREETRPMRSKEFANDYRYFPEPDLPPLRVPPDLVEKVRTEMPELPDATPRPLHRRLRPDGIRGRRLIDEREVADYFEATLPGTEESQGRGELGHDRSAARRARKRQVDRRGGSAGGEVGALLKMVEEGKISLNAAKTAFAAMCNSRKDAEATIARTRPRAGFR